jgi:hypothetical protein
VTVWQSLCGGDLELVASDDGSPRDGRLVRGFPRLRIVSPHGDVLQEPAPVRTVPVPGATFPFAGREYELANEPPVRRRERLDDGDGFFWCEVRR